MRDHRTRLAFLLLFSALPVAAQVKSPEIHADGRATLRLASPNAEKVELLGDWRKPDQTIELAKGDDGVWSVTVDPLEPGAYIYGFSVDGEAMPDPVNPAAKLRAAGVGSLLQIPGNPPALWEARDVPHGEVRILFEKSPVLNGETRWMFVYTPPGYDQSSDKRYPTLYLLHGSNDTAAGWVMVGAANYILDNLIADGKANPMIVVMPFGHAVPFSDREGRARNTPLFERYLLEDVMPMIESRFRTVPGRNARALVGLSMGGGQALTIGFNHLDLFSAIGAYSAAVPGEFEQRFAEQLAEPDKLNERLKLLWFACGRDDRLFERSEKLSELLKAKGAKHTFEQTEGVHNYAAWRKYLASTAPLLFR